MSSVGRQRQVRVSLWLDVSKVPVVSCPVVVETGPSDGDQKERTDIKSVQKMSLERFFL